MLFFKSMKEIQTEIEFRLIRIEKQEQHRENLVTLFFNFSQPNKLTVKIT